MGDGRGGRAWRGHRAKRLAMAAEADETCCRCHLPIDYTLDGRLRMGPTCDHLVTMESGGQLLAPFHLLGPAHNICNSMHGARIGGAKRKAGFLVGAPPGDPPLRASLSPTGEPSDHGWADRHAADLWGLSDRPEAARWPRFMTAPHPKAVGSLYDDFAAFCGPRAKMHPKRTVGQRWWQELVARRALEVDSDGRLLWRTVVVSTPRQQGKSWLVRELCLWRLTLAQGLGEVQTVLHTAMKLQHADVIWRPAARWAVHRSEYEVRFTNGEQRIEGPDGSVWLIQAANDGLGVSQSVSLALVDEAWGVPRELIDNGLEPTMLEAEQPQLWIISTAGVPSRGDRLTDLVPGYRAIGADRDQAGVLYLEWSAPAAADDSDPETWRAASAEWSPQRQDFIGAKRAKADKPEEVEAFRRQYLNVWPDQADGLGEDALIDADRWARLRAPGLPIPEQGPMAAAVEDHFGQGGAWALAWWDGPTLCVIANPAPLPQAWQRAALSPRVLCGASLVDGEHARSAAAVPVTSRELAAAMSELRSLVADGRIRWDGDELGAQAAAAKVRQGAGNLLRPQVPGGDTVLRAALFAVGDLARNPVPAFWVM
jgi:hypothetical protein